MTHDEALRDVVEREMSKTARGRDELRRMKLQRREARKVKLAFRWSAIAVRGRVIHDSAVNYRESEAI